MARIIVAPEMESLQDAAARTGFSVGTFRNLIAEGRLPAYRLSNKPKSAIRVKVVDVDNLFLTVPTVTRD